MDNKKSKDAFASTSLGGGDKYLKRHQDAVRLERANELDKRIADFDAKPHNINWANEALDFCKREEEAGKDLADISKGYNDLARIKKEAHDIIKAEENRKINEKIAEEQAFLKELAKEFDERFDVFVSKTHDVEWATSAIDFCDREKTASKEFSAFSKNYQKLDKLKQEAKDIISEAEKLQKAEKEKLKLKQQELELKNKQEEDNLVASLEKDIEALSKAKRTPEWIDQVEKTYLIVKGLPIKVYTRIKNRYLIDNFNKECVIFKEALALDEQIMELSAVRQKNRTWANKVFDLEKNLQRQYDKYLSNKTTFYEISTLATKIAYGEDLSALEDYMKNVETNKNMSESASEFKAQSDAVEKLRSVIYIDEFIGDFEKRWLKVKKEIELFNAKKKEEEKKIAEAKAKEVARQKEIEAEAKRVADEKARAEARKRAKRERQKEIALKTFLIVLHIGVVAGIGIFGALNISNPMGLWTLSIGVPLMFMYVWFRWARNLGSMALKKFIIYTLSLAVVACNVASIFVESFSAFGIYMLPALIAMVLTCIIQIVLLSKYSINVAYSVIGIINIMALAYTLSFMVGLVAIYVGVGLLLASAVAMLVVSKDYDQRPKKRAFGLSIFTFILVAVVLFIYNISPVITWILSVSGAGILLFLGFKFIFDLDPVEERRIAPIILLTLSVLGVSIASIFTDAFGLYLLPILGATLILLTVENYCDNKWSYDIAFEWSTVGVISLFVVGAVKTYCVLTPILGGVYSALIAFAILLVMTVIIIVNCCLDDTSEKYAIAWLSLIIGLIAVVISFFDRWDFILIGAGLMISALALTICRKVIEREDVGESFVSLFLVVLIIGVVLMGISCIIAAA